MQKYQICWLNLFKKNWKFGSGGPGSARKKVRGLGSCGPPVPPPLIIAPMQHRSVVAKWYIWWTLRHVQKVLWNRKADFRFRLRLRFHHIKSFWLALRLHRQWRFLGGPRGPFPQDFWLASRFSPQLCAWFHVQVPLITFSQQYVNYNLEAQLIISQMQNKLGCCSCRPGNGICWWPHIPVVARILHDISSNRGLGGERFSLI